MVPWLVGSTWSGIRKPSGKTGVFHTRLSEQPPEHWSCLSSSSSPVVFSKQKWHIYLEKSTGPQTQQKSREKKTGPKKTTWKKTNISYIIPSTKNQRKKTKTLKKNMAYTKPSPYTLIFFLQKSKGRFQKPKSHRLTWSAWSWSFATFAKAWKLRMAEHALYDENCTHTPKNWLILGRV